MNEVNDYKWFRRYVVRRDPRSGRMPYHLHIKREEPS